MTQISGVPDELHGYTEATTGSTYRLSSAAAVALAGINAFNAANAASDMPGTIADVATPVDQEADILLDHDRIPAAFADALLALDADGLADPDGRYDIDARYDAFVGSLVNARVEDPYGTVEEVFDQALTDFDAGFAQTFADVRANDPTALTADIWETAIGEQARKDADALDLYVSDGFDESGEGMAYEGLRGLLAAIEARSNDLDDYAKQLYIDNLGAEGIEAVLDGIGELRPDDDVPIRSDLIEPFAAGFAVAAASGPAADAMIRDLTTYGNASPTTSQMERLGMLVTGADQPAAFLVPAAETMIRHGSTPPDNLPPLEVFFGQDPGTWEIIAVEALAANPDASADFAARDNGYQINLRNLIYGPIATFMDDDQRARYLEASGTVLEHAIVTEGEFGTGGERTPTDELLINVIELSQNHVPDQMKDQLASLSVSSMGRIQDFVLAGGELESEVQAYFAELSQSDFAVAALTNGAIDQLAAETATAIDIYAGFDHAAPSVATLDGVLYENTKDARRLLGTLGAAFNDAKVSDEQSHAAMIGALNWIGDGAPRVGVAAVGLTGGTGALVGVGTGAVADLVIAIIDRTAAPDAPDDSIAFVESVGPRTEAALTRLLFDDPEARALLVDQAFVDEVEPDPASLSFEGFAGLHTVRAIVGPTGSQINTSVILDILYNDFRR